MRIVIPGQPVAWGRARLGGRGHFTPKQVRTWQGIARTAAAAIMGDRPPVDRPVHVLMWFLMDVPSSWPAWKREAALAGTVVPTGRPDLDNLVKNVEDAFNQIVWRDDQLIFECWSTKLYTDRPRTVVEVVESKRLGAQGARKRDLPRP